MKLTIDIKLDRDCPVCAAESVASTVRVRDVPLAVDGWLVYYLECSREHIFSNSFALPPGSEIPIIIPGITGH